MNRREDIMARLRRDHGEEAGREALRRSWEARRSGATEEAGQLLTAAIRLCRKG